VSQVPPSAPFTPPSEFLVGRSKRVMEALKAFSLAPL